MRLLLWRRLDCLLTRQDCVYLYFLHLVGYLKRIEIIFKFSSTFPDRSSPVHDFVSERDFVSLLHEGQPVAVGFTIKYGMYWILLLCIARWFNSHRHLLLPFTTRHFLDTYKPTETPWFGSCMLIQQTYLLMRSSFFFGRTHACHTVPAALYCFPTLQLVQMCSHSPLWWYVPESSPRDAPTCAVHASKFVRLMSANFSVISNTLVGVHLTLLLSWGR